MIIVTGGAGFIGSNLVKGLNDQGTDDILVVDNLSNSAKHLNLNGVRIADYMDKGDLLGSLARLPNLEAIFHQGACSSTTESDGRYMMKNNFEYTKALFHWATARKIPFIYASSAAVYGNGDDGFVEEPRCEYPLNVYGFSKFAFDNYLRRHLADLASPVVGLRYFNVYGPQENHKGRMASVAFHLFHQLKRGENMKLFEGSDTFKRDFVHVDDCVAVNLHFLDSGTTGIFNCGTGQARTFGDIARVLKERIGGELETIPFPADLVGKYQAFTEASLAGLRAAGYDRPFRSLEEGVTAYCDVLEATGGYRR